MPPEATPPALIQDIVLKNLQQEGLLLDNRPIHFIVGFSGGMDSVVLLHTLWALSKTYNLKITAAFYEHRWGSFPADELPIIDQHCNTHNIPLIIVPVDHNVAKTETAARQARYKSLAQLAQDLNATALLTAHHADDQIETILFRLFRGTGLDGLTGIRRKRILHEDVGATIPILRPMLNVSRDQVRAYAKGQNTENTELIYFQDPSNTNKEHQRNLIRHEIIPFLNERFPHMEQSLHRLTRTVDGDLQIINEKINDLWNELYDNDDETLDAYLLNQLARPYQRRLVRRFLNANSQEAGFSQVEDFIDFVEGEGRNSQQSALMSLAQPKTEDGSEQQATKPRFLFLYKNQLSIVEERPSESMDDRDIQVEPVNVALPGTTELPELNLQLVIEPILEPAEEELDEDETDGDEDEDEKAPDIKESKKPAFKASKPSVALTSQRSRTVYVNMDNFLSSPLQLRTRQTGDRLHPLGMASEMRLKNYFINRGISRFKRDDIPLLAIGTAVLWAAGVGISEHLRVDAYNEATHKLSIEPIPEKKEIEFEVPVENMANQMENQQDNFEQHQQSDNYDDDEDIDENTLEETQFDENYEEAPLS